MKFRNKAKISLIIIIFYLTFCASSFTQKNDYHWILGYDPNIPEEMFGGVDIYFGSYPPDINYIYLAEDCDLLSNSVVSNDNGELIAYTNACKLFNSDHVTMLNGDSLNSGVLYDLYCNTGRNPWDLIMLPKPGTSTFYGVFHIRETPGGAADILYTEFTVNEDGDSFVKLKNDFLVSVNYADQLTAVKHGNGRDWWIIAPEGESNDYMFILYSKSGIEIKMRENIGHEWNYRYWSSQSVVSPDGRWYVRGSAFNGLNIFEMDRCLGVLSNPLLIESHLDTFSDVSGVAFSMNSRFLYVSTGLKVVQFDMMAVDIEQSQLIVAEYDGYASPFPTNFYQLALAPDGRIYCASTSGNNVMHVIKYPNKKGEACQFMNHGYPLPVHMTFALPNVPYYRLGPEDGSACDTLGMDNIPVAHWRYDEESPEIQFSDLSYFNPSSWYWDFGDGETNNEQSPIHQYNATGTYTVCLTVSNEYGTDIECQDVTIITTSDADLEQNERIIIAPNPVGDILEIICKSPALVRLKIVGSDGVTKFNRSVTLPCKIDVSSLESGFYILIAKEANDVFMFRKIIKL